jgi:hypothetical protein
MSEENKLFKKELLNRTNPNQWNSNDWFNFLMMLQDERNIPIVLKNNNIYVLNPNLGYHDIEANNPGELINQIANNSEFKDLRLQLYNSIMK